MLLNINCGTGILSSERDGFDGAHMKLCRTIIILAALLPFVPPTLAQLAPVQLQVIKTKNR